MEPAGEKVGTKVETIFVFATGGTFDKVYYDALSDYRIGDPQIADILALAGVDKGDYVLESVIRKDSLDMDDADRATLRERAELCGGRRILIVHGTDTMTDTAAKLKGLGGEGFTVVLTGAMQPARFKDSDAAFNAGFAFAAARTLPPGVYIAMHGRVFVADKVRKSRDAGGFEATD